MTVITVNPRREQDGVSRPQFLPIVEKEEAGYCSKHQDYRHIKLELFIFVLVGKSKEGGKIEH